jgi:NAD+ kinase
MADRDRPARIEQVRIVAKRHRPGALAAVRRVTRWLDRHGVRVTLDPGTARALGRRKDARPLGGVSHAPDLYVVIGGDGTLLSVARAAARRPRPILGVNLGGLGFLTETTLDEAEGMLADIIEGRYVLDRRMALDVTLVRAGRSLARHTVLNDVVINKGALARIIDLHLSIDRQFVTVLKADGVVVASPTGSTAYSLSAGGPIIHPQLEALVIAPICPHTLTMRPLVVPQGSRIEISLRSDESETYLTLDGQIGHPLKARDRVRVNRSGYSALMVRSRRTSFFEVLRHKLHWGER